MPSIERSIDIDVPVEVVYHKWTQFEEFPRFMAGVQYVRQLDDDRLQWVAEIAGQEASWEARITEQRPHERIAWTSTDGKPNGGVVTFHRLSDTSSRVMVQIEWEAEGLMETVGGYLGADDRRVAGDLDRFKELIEREGDSAGWDGEIEAGEVVTSKTA